MTKEDANATLYFKKLKEIIKMLLKKIEKEKDAQYYFSEVKLSNDRNMVLVKRSIVDLVEKYSTVVKNIILYFGSNRMEK